MDTKKNYTAEGFLGATFTHICLFLILFFVLWGSSSSTGNSNDSGSGQQLEVMLGNDINGSGAQHAQATTVNIHQQESSHQVQTSSDVSENLLRTNEVGNELTLLDANTSQSNTAEQAYAGAVYPNGNNQNQNHGNTGLTGNMGRPDGTPNGTALENSTGTGTGSLDMAGWIWNSKPRVDDRTDEGGRIKFRIRITADGEIESVTAVEKSVSPSLVRLYQAEVEKLNFSRSDGRAATEGAVGYITFVIHAK